MEQQPGPLPGGNAVLGTEPTSQWIGKSLGRGSWLGMDQMKREIDKVNLTEIAEMYSSFDRAVDTLIEKGRELGASIPCKRGCDACCYDIALATQFEIPPIVDAVRELSEDDQQKIRSQLIEWTKALGQKSISLNEYDIDVRKYHSEPRAACPLLDRDKHECMVYAQRPLSCRGHVLINQEPSACSQRAVNPEITCLMTQNIAAQGILHLVKLHARKKADTVGVGVLMLGSMLLKAWNLVEQTSEPDYVEWLEGIVREGELSVV